MIRFSPPHPISDVVATLKALLDSELLAAFTTANAPTSSALDLCAKAPPPLPPPPPPPPPPPSPPQAVNIALDVRSTGPVIAPQLYGHDLEFTRHDLYAGLSAELVVRDGAPLSLLCYLYYYRYLHLLPLAPPLPHSCARALSLPLCGGARSRSLCVVTFYIPFHGTTPLSCMLSRTRTHVRKSELIEPSDRWCWSDH